MEGKVGEKLILIYNAKSGTRNAFFDSMHKMFSPNTYDCILCKITYRVFSENRVWKRFRQENQHEMVFLHKDEFTKKYKSKFGYKFSFPIVLTEGENGLEVLISTEELNRLNTANGLIRLLKDRT